MTSDCVCHQVRLETYSKTFVVMNLCSLSNEQQRRVINIQMEGNVFFDHLLSLGEVRKNLDDAYKKISANMRSELEALWSEDLFHKRGSADGQVPQYDPEQRQKIADGSRIVAVTQRMASQMLRTIDQKLKSTDNACKVALLDRIDTVIKNYPIDGEADTEGDLADKVLEDMLTPTAVPQTFQKVAIKLGVLLQKERKEYNTQLELDKAKGKASKERVVLLATAVGVWENVVANTDEIYCVHESMQEPWADMVKAGASAARSDYCFVIGAGLVPVGPWPTALSDGIGQLYEASEAGLLPLPPRPGLIESMKATFLTQNALLTGYPDPRHAVLAKRSTLLTGATKFRLFRLGASVSDRKIHRSSR